MAAKQLIGSILQLMFLLSTLLFSFTKIGLAIIHVKVTYILVSFRHRMQHLGDRLVFSALRASLGWSRSFLRRGALMLFTVNGAHRLLRGYLLTIGHAGMAGSGSGSGICVMW